MSTTSSSTLDGVTGVAALLAVLVGAAITGYGLLLLSVSPLGGAWIAAIGLSLALAGAFATEWAGDRLGLDPGTRRTLSLSFAGLSLVLLVAFVVLNYASFQSFESFEAGE